MHSRRADLACIAAIAAAGLLLLAPGLGHPAIRNWDEAFHQAAARGTYETFFEPHLYSDPLHQVDPRWWWASGVFLHKPAGPLWVAAALMHLIGVTPLALRLCSLAGELGAAIGLFLLARSMSGRALALLAAIGFLALPFAWRLTQGFHFGDVTDCTLVGWVTLSMLLLVRAIERSSWRWAAAAGAAVGVGFLCKTALALVPLGVAFAVWGLGRVRASRPFPFAAPAAMAGAFAAVALPWNLYAALKWPVTFRAAIVEMSGHILARHLPEVGPWGRPWDAVFNELNATELSPLPAILPLAAVVWLCIRAVRRREAPAIACALWVVATWAIHSLMFTKVPGQVWGAVPAVFVALAVLGRDAAASPPAAAALLGSLATPLWMRALPWTSVVRRGLPDFFQQTRTLPGLAEGACSVLAALALVFAARSLLQKRPAALSIPLAAASLCALGWTFAWQLPAEQDALASTLSPEGLVSYSADVGPALDRALPKEAVLYQDVDLDPPGMFEIQSLMFWSGRMVYRGPPDVGLAASRGYKAYLISPAAEPFEPVGDVPAHAPLRAYDPQRPAPPPPLPAGVTPLAADLPGMHVLGYAAARIDGGHDRYAFYVRPDGVPTALRVVFGMKDRRAAEVRLVPEQSLRRASRLERVPWFILPAIGPPHDRIAGFGFAPG